MRRIRTAPACLVVACLVVTVVLGGCDSRSAAKEGGVVCCPSPWPSPCKPCPAPCNPCPAPRQARAVARTVTPAAHVRPLPAPGTATSATATSGATTSGRQTSPKYGRPGSAVYEEDGHLWVFEQGSEALSDFRSKGEPAKRITRIGAGPDGRSVIGPDNETLDSYLAGRR